MKMPLILTTILALLMLTTGLAQSNVNWVHDTDQTNSFVFAVEKNGGTFVYLPTNYFKPGVQAVERKAYNESQGEFDPYNAIAEGEILEFGTSFGGELRMHALAMGPDQDENFNPASPANGLKVQAFAQILPDLTMNPNLGMDITQEVTTWSTRWFTVDEELVYELRAQLGGTVSFDEFFISSRYHATKIIGAEITLEALVVSTTGSIISLESVFSEMVDFEAPVARNLILSPTTSSDQQITYQLKTRVYLKSEVTNFDWNTSIITGGIDGTFNLGTPESPIALTATIAKPTISHLLTTACVNGDGGSISPESGPYLENSVVNLTATPKPGYRVDKWSGTDNDDITTTANTVTMTDDRNVLISYELIPTYTLSSAVLPNDAGAVTIDPLQDAYEENTVVSLKAEARSQYQFVRWDGAAVADPMATVTTITMGEDHSVTAVFEEIPPGDSYTLASSVTPEAAGTIATDPLQERYAENTVVTLTATANIGYLFHRWDGAVENPDASSTTIAMDEDHSVTAVFEEIPPGDSYTLASSVTPEEAGTITTDPLQESYAENTVVTLTATANIGYLFDRWDGAVENPKASSTTIVMGENRQVSALFLEMQDDDTDGVDDLIEQGPDPDNPNPYYDGNNDGIPDHLQGQVVSMPTHDGQHYVTLACEPSHNLREVSCVPPVADVPSGITFPFGCFDFKIDGIEPGGSTYVNIILPEGTVPDAYFKFGPKPDDTSDHWYEFSRDSTTGAVIDGNTITLFFLDGDRGDDDLTQNALIVDLGGPVLRASSSTLITDAPEPETPPSESRDNSCFIAMADGKTASELLRSISTFLRHIGSAFYTGAP
ncbi:choice-of-anchor U domain-containing protein [Desulfoluna sp.]|uniref:InlB B-repeat-containing protein n=1 Tax=Desulfoluna sp. TaxID=2045199 RepID=UPI002613FFE4|nr:choice-of-anchor U domain-containing protein [Desulfoluna sp.]